MFAALALLFLVVPFLELFVAIQVAHVIGGLPTIVALVVISAVGASMVKRAGVGVWRRTKTQLDARQLPAKELVDGVLVLFAGTLLLTPGFITDVLGIALLAPPVRDVVRRLVTRLIENRIGLGRGQGAAW